MASLLHSAKSQMKASLNSSASRVWATPDKASDPIPRLAINTDYHRFRLAAQIESSIVCISPQKQF